MPAHFKTLTISTAVALAAASTPALAVTYVEGVDVDTYTAATDAFGQPTRTPFVLDAGVNEFSGTINSPSDPSDFIPIQVLEGLKLTGLTVVTAVDFDFSGTRIFFSNAQGFDVIDQPLGSFSTPLDLGPNFYGIQFGSGVVAASYTVTFNVARTGNPTGAVPEPSTWLMLLLGFAAIGSTLRRQRAQERLRFA